MKLRILLIVGLLVGLMTVSPVIGEADVNQIGLAVVQIVVYSGDEVISTGSGTIIAPTGLIYTNWHVVDGGDDFGIAILGDINELPILSYYATLQAGYEDIDVAVLQIDRNIRGRTLDPNVLNLPFLPISDAEVTRGDDIIAFGYPDIGDGYLVVTKGTITTIQNGQVNGEAMPVVYQTSAELAPGNSGGAAVNNEGELIGIPFYVSSEDRTGGRLGGLIPISLVILVLADENAQVVRNTSNNGNTTPDPTVTGGVDIDCGGGVAIEDGIETMIVQMRAGYAYTVTVVGMGGFEPLLAIVTEFDDVTCVNTPSAPATFSVNLPTTGLVTDMTNSIQVQFSQNTGQNLADMRLVVGGAGGSFGEFILILEGMAFNEFDGDGDPIIFSATPRMKNSLVPMTVYMIGIVDVLDPLMFISNGERAILVCDDAGNDELCPSSESLTGGFVSRADASVLASDALDAMISLPLIEFNGDKTIIDYLPFFMASSSYASYGHYIFAFHASSR